VDPGAVAQLDDAQRLELPEGLAHGRRRNGELPCERLHGGEPVAASERLTLDQREHLLGDEVGDGGRRAVVATASSHGYPVALSSRRMTDASSDEQHHGGKVIR